MPRLLIKLEGFFLYLPKIIHRVMCVCVCMCVVVYVHMCVLKEIKPLELAMLPTIAPA